MNNFIYYTPTKVYFGKEYHNEVGKIIKDYKFKKVLIHYGQNSVIKSGLLQQVQDRLEEQGINYVLLGGVEPNPKLSLVLKAKELCKQENVDLILAVGGGSVIDSAKLIAYAVKCDFNPWLFNIKEKLPQEALPVGTILTLAAAGSEMSSSCVITNDETLEKRGFNSDTNRPLFSILNPELTFTVSKFQTGCGIVDILMHTMERYYADLDEVIVSDYVALAVCKSVIDAGKKCYNNPTDYNSRAALMWASSISHNDLTGVGRNMSTPVHQIEHEISGMFDHVAHGAGLSAVYCSWARYVYKYNLDRFQMFAVEVMGVDKNLNKEEAALKGIDLLEQYFKDINMPTSLNELNISTDDKTLEELSVNVTFNYTRIIDDFKKIGYEETLDILKMAK